MNRLLFLWMLALSLLQGCGPSVPETPNILFIVVDDLGYKDVGFMGSEYYETPNIDRIAGGGMVFTNGYATCAVCSPSRASLLSGKFTARHGITDWIGAPEGTDWRRYERHTKMLPPPYLHHLPQAYVTLPEALKEHGYTTFFAGKWHLGGKGYYPEDNGFDINIGGYETGSPPHGRYFSPFHDPKMKDLPEEKGMALSMKLAQETARFIEQHKDEKFLAYLAFYSVHAPIQTTRERWKRFRDKADSMGIAPQGFAMERRFPYRLHQDNPVYAGLISQMDDAVGYVLRTLDSLHLDKKTIVIFTSDNGGVISGDAFSTNLAPLRGGKGYQWEGGIRVPYVINVPWMHLAGKKNDTPVTGADFYPTLLDLAGLPLLPGQHTDGVSLVPLLQGDTIPSRPLYWHYPHYGNQGGDPAAMIREGHWKLIHYWEDGSDELYDLNKDLSEQENVAEQYPEITRSMSKKLLDWLRSVNAKYPVPDPLFSPDSLQMKHEWYREVLWPRLEERRKRMLSPDWQPNKDWWGSEGGRKKE
jgi:arylsulfatase A-like enzyme